MNGLSHIGADGTARMVDVSAKTVTARRATAEGRIHLSPAAIAAVCEGSGPKGEVLATARIAGIQAAKRTAGLIPLCHPLPLAAVSIGFAIADDAVTVTAEVVTSAQTGVEIEAMTATCIALLTIYDMTKALDRSARIEAVRLIAKSGGKSGVWRAD